MEFKRSGSFGLALGFVLFSFAVQADVKVNEARERLLGLLEDSRNRGQELLPEVLDQTQALIRNYRWHGTMSTIQNAPFLGLLFAQNLEGYLPRKEPVKADALPLEPVYDFLIDGILSGSLPPVLEDAGSQVGKCLAEKIAQARDGSCSLVTNNPSSPGAFTLFFHKLTCGIALPTPCQSRRTVFEGLKASFVDQLTAIARKFPQNVNTKFGGTSRADVLWSAPLIEGDDSSRDLRTSLEEFGAGLRADSMAAAVLAQSSDPALRGMAAPLFFAAANRLLMVAGGEEAPYSKRQFRLNEPAISNGPAPLFKTRVFGGWGGARVDGKFRFSPWDLKEYDPGLPGGVRIFPEEVLFTGLKGWRGVPALLQSEASPIQTLSGLAELLSGAAEFLKVTRSEGPLGPYFGPSSELGKSLVDPSKNREVFPTEGRLLAAGVGATVLKNLVAPNDGHLELLSAGSPDGGLGMAFHERVTLEGRIPGAPSVEAVSKTLLAIGAFREAIAGDTSLPGGLLEQVSKLDTALQVGVLVLRAEGQGLDGGFEQKLKAARADGVDSLQRLTDTIWGLRALTEAFDASQMSVLRLGVKQAWLFMDRIWDSNSAFLSERMKWQALLLWSESQKAVRPALTAEMDWSHWEARMEALRVAMGRPFLK